jgi:ADP-heptose:LPS heptosyltransferase
MSKAIDFTNINKVCFFFPHGIGDVICTTPFISALREHKPQLHLTVIVKNDSIAQLFGSKTKVDQIITFDIYKKNNFKQTIKFINDLRKEHFDLFISDHPGKTPLLAFLIGAKISIGEKSKFFSFLYTHSFITNFNEHKVVNNWKMLEILGIDIKHNPSVYFDNNDLSFVTAKIPSIFNLEDFIIVHPGCGAWGTHKRWHANKFSDLIKLIIQHYPINIFLVGDHDEIEMCNEISLRVNAANVVSVAGQLSIRQLSALLSKAKLAIGNDSGIMHLASACNVKTITLFGPTIYKWCAPFVNNIVISKNLACSPCYLQMPYGCGNPVCMELIEVNEVYDIIKNEMINNKINFI